VLEDDRGAFDGGEYVSKLDGFCVRGAVLTNRMFKALINPGITDSDLQVMLVNLYC
jgi:hypothetical protein